VDLQKDSMATQDDELPPRKIGRDAPPHDLTQAAAALVNTGALPRDDDARILAGPGEGRPCSLCADTIEPADVEYEMASGAARSYHFHIACYFAWKRAAGSTDGGGGNG
jgi:hypothetical protein